MLSKGSLIFSIIALSVILKFLILYILGVEAFPDSVWYINTAEEIYNNNFVYPDSELKDAPGSPYFYALFYPLTQYFGLNGLAIGNIVIASISVYIFYRISLLIFNDIQAANIAALSAAVYPFFNFYSITILTEIIYIFLLYVAIYFFIKFYKTNNIYYFLLFSIFFALDGLVRFVNLPMFFFFVMLAIVLMIKNNCKGVFIFKTVALGSVCFVLVMSPWWMRNYQVFGEFVATSVGESGKVFFSGNNPHNKSGGGIGGIDVAYEDLSRFEKIKDLKKRDKAMFQEGLNWIKNNPSDWVILEFRKLKRLYSPVFYAEKYSAWYYNLLSIVSYGTVLVLFLVSLFTLRSYFWAYSPMLLYLFLLTGVHLVFIASIRYRLPLEPFMLIMSSKVLGDLFKKYNLKVVN